MPEESRSRSHTGQSTGASPRRGRRNLHRLLNRGRRRTEVVLCATSEGNHAPIAWQGLVRAHDCRCSPPRWHQCNHTLVKEGWCWWYRKHAAGDTVLERLETEAREARKGLWADPGPVPPWEWRKR